MSIDINETHKNMSIIHIIKQNLNKKIINENTYVKRNVKQKKQKKTY